MLLISMLFYHEKSEAKLLNRKRLTVDLVCLNCPVDFKLSMMILETVRFNVKSVATLVADPLEISGETTALVLINDFT